MAKFRAKKFEPEAYTLYSYAGVQIIKQAAEAAKSLDPKKVAEKMHSGMQFKTVIGDISYDKKGDITSLDYVMYIWKKDSERQDHLRRMPRIRLHQSQIGRRVVLLKSPPTGGLFSSDLAEGGECFEQPYADLVYAAGQERQARQDQ